MKKTITLVSLCLCLDVTYSMNLMNLTSGSVSLTQIGGLLPQLRNLIATIPEAGIRENLSRRYAAIPSGGPGRIIAFRSLLQETQTQIRIQEIPVNAPIVEPVAHPQVAIHPAHVVAHPQAAIYHAYVAASATTEVVDREIRAIRIDNQKQMKLVADHFKARNLIGSTDDDIFKAFNTRNFKKAYEHLAWESLNKKIIERFFNSCFGKYVNLIELSQYINNDSLEDCIIFENNNDREIFKELALIGLIYFENTKVLPKIIL